MLEEKSESVALAPVGASARMTSLTRRSGQFRSNFICDEYSEVLTYIERL